MFPPIYILCQRVTKDFFFFLFFFIVNTTVPLLFVYRCYPKAVVLYYFFSSFFIAEILWLLCNLIHANWGSKIKVVLLWIISFYSIVNAFIWNKFENIISPYILDILVSSNTSEIREFCSMYITIDWILVIVLFPFALVLLYIILRKRFLYFSTKFLWLFIILTCGFIFLTIYSPVLMKESLTGGLWNYEMGDHVDLYQHLTYPNLVERRVDHPQKIIVIIGESFSKSHSSLYGYSKETNPKLAELKEKGDLIVFEHVTSPSTNTMIAFQQILGTYDVNQKQCRKHWYDCPNIIEMARALDYRTFWISNQSNYPMIDDVCGTLARFCDEYHYNKEDGSGYDGFLIQFNYSQKTQKDFILYHLLGQHGKYAMRFPQEFACYTPNDYEQVPLLQRQVLADYDNATLYNDYVVSSLMTLYSKTDAIVFYFPDHGQDLFETDNEKYGHGRVYNSESVKVATQIPFVLYTNPTFRQMHPEAMEWIQKIKNNAFNTTDFYKILLAVLGYQLLD